LHRLDENLAALSLQLAAVDMQEIDSAAAAITVVGDRYAAAVQQLSDRD
jgi:diketogulonate reductase-like aldo/keto reductase